MNARRWVQLSVMAVLLGVSMSGCGRGIFNTEPFVDARKDEHGNTVLLDTDRNWQDWRDAVDPQIRAEVSGRNTPGFPSWNEKWVAQLLAIERTQEDASNYIAYIIESRRRAGLPELEGYALPAGD